MNLWEGEMKVRRWAYGLYLGFILGALGVSIFTWQYWAVVLPLLVELSRD